jgi:FkbM family methyltransferase
MFKKIKYIYGGNISFSQEGEDILLQRLMGSISSKGFFVDIGAHHPLRFSNTYSFYLHGWRGINVDPNPENMRLFNLIRPEDINITRAVSSHCRKLEYFMFDEPALNTLDSSQAKKSIELGYILLKKVRITTTTLKEILDNYLPKDVTQIDVLSIDTEGFDLNVLESNDWLRYHPTYIIVESLDEVNSSSNKKISLFLESKNYKQASILSNSMIFCRN